jgi:hypothetical protein
MVTLSTAQAMGGKKPEPIKSSRILRVQPTMQHVYNLAVLGNNNTIRAFKRSTGSATPSACAPESRRRSAPRQHTKNIAMMQVMAVVVVVVDMEA